MSLIRVLFAFILMVLSLSVHAEKSKKPSPEVTVSMDGLKVYDLKNPTYLKTLNKDTFKAKSNDLVVDLTINLQDRGVKKDVAGCVDGMIQKSKIESRLNSYSVEALGLICANYRRRDYAKGVGMAQYFEGGFILHKGDTGDGTTGLLVINGAENKEVTIAAMNGLPVEKIDVNIEKNKLDAKYCTSTSGYTSEACSQLKCGKVITPVSRSISTATDYEYTSCQRPACKGLAGALFRRMIIGTDSYDESSEKTQKKLKLFGDIYVKYKLKEQVKDDDCIPCPSGYKFNNVECVDSYGCAINEKFENGACKLDMCAKEDIVTVSGSCRDSCKSMCEKTIDDVTVLLQKNGPLRLSDAANLAGSSFGVFFMSNWEQKNSKNAAELSSQLRSAAEIYLEKLKNTKKCNPSECLVSQEIIDVLNQYNICESGEVIAYNTCVKTQCIECEKAEFDLEIYQGSLYNSIHCGSQHDQMQIYSYLIQQAKSEYLERSVMCRDGRVDVCKEFQPITESDIRNMARRIGIDCAGSSKSLPASSGKH